MKIEFHKIGATASPFEINEEGIVLEGTLQKIGSHRVSLDGRLWGDLELSCDRCGATFVTQLDNALILKLSDTVSEDKDDLDIIEFLDGEIDILYIVQSELNAFKSNYNYCTKCNNSDEDFEIEY
ncbi:MAG: hypothetical protein RLZZ428_1063 [Pseudomonadota bacterium]